MLARRQGEILSKTAIAELVWDMNFDSNTNVVEVAIKRLRAKIDNAFAPKLLHTIRGMGYVMEARDEARRRGAGGVRRSITARLVADVRARPRWSTFTLIGAALYGVLERELTRHQNDDLQHQPAEHALLDRALRRPRALGAPAGQDGHADARPTAACASGC